MIPKGTDPNGTIFTNFANTMALYPNLIKEALQTVRYPGTGKDIISMEMLEDDIRIDGNSVSFSLIFEKPTDPFIKSIVKSAETAVKLKAGQDVQVEVKVKSRQAPRPEGPELLPDVKNIIQLSILRQMNSHVLDAFLGTNEQCKYERYLYLRKLLDILEDA